MNNFFERKEGKSSSQRDMNHEEVGAKVYKAHIVQILQFYLIIDAGMNLGHAGQRIQPLKAIGTISKMSSTLNFITERNISHFRGGCTQTIVLCDPFESTFILLPLFQPST